MSTITFVVKNHLTGSFINHAQVSISAKHEFTDSNGEVSINVPAGNYYTISTASGYENYFGFVNNVPERDQTVSIFMHKTASPEQPSEPDEPPSVPEDPPSTPETPSAPDDDVSASDITVSGLDIFPANPGQLFQVSFRIENTGPGTNVKAKSILRTPMTISSPEKSIDLGQGQYKSIALKLNLPTDFPEGPLSGVISVMRGGEEILSVPYSTTTEGFGEEPNGGQTATEITDIDIDAPDYADVGEEFMVTVTINGSFHLAGVPVKLVDPNTGNEIANNTTNSAGEVNFTSTEAGLFSIGVVYGGSTQWSTIEIVQPSSSSDLYIDIRKVELTPPSNQVDVFHPGEPISVYGMGEIDADGKYKITIGLMDPGGGWIASERRIRDLNEGEELSLERTLNLPMDYEFDSVTIFAIGYHEDVTAQDNWYYDDVRTEDFPVEPLPTVPGGPEDADVNGDGVINLTDLALLGQAWGSSSGDANWNPDADLDGDGTVGLGDLALIGKHWGQTYGEPACPFNIWEKYDENNNGYIDDEELDKAISDWEAGDITDTCHLAITTIWDKHTLNPNAGPAPQDEVIITAPSTSVAGQDIVVHVEFNEASLTGVEVNLGSLKKTTNFQGDVTFTPTQMGELYITLIYAQTTWSKPITITEPGGEEVSATIEYENTLDIPSEIQPGTHLLLKFRLTNTGTSTNTFASGISINPEGDTSSEIKGAWKKDQLDPLQEKIIELGALLPTDANVGTWEIKASTWEGWSEDGTVTESPTYFIGGILSNRLNSAEPDPAAFTVVEELPPSIPDEEYPNFFGIPADDLPQWYKTWLDISGWVSSLPFGLHKLASTFLLESVRITSFSLLSFFHYLATEKKEMTDSDLEEFLLKHGDWLSAGNVMSIYLTGKNMKGESQEEPTPGDWLKFLAFFSPLILKAGSVFGAKFGPWLAHRLGARTAYKIGLKSAEVAWDPIMKAPVVAKAGSMTLIGKILSVIKAPFKVTLMPFLQPSAYAALSPMGMILHAFVTWNVLTDWVWIQGMGRQMLDKLTGDSLNRYKSLQISLNNQLKQLHNDVAYALTGDDYASIYNQIQFLKPEIAEFKKIIDDEKLFQKVSDDYPEAEAMFLRWQQAIEKFEEEARTKAGLVAPVAKEFEGIVTKIRDGDTIEVQYKRETVETKFEPVIEVIRLLGIDTPEVDIGTEVSKLSGKLAKDYLVNFLPLGTIVRVTYDEKTPRDVYGRLLGTVYKGDESVNYAMRATIPGDLKVYTSPTHASIYISGTPNVEGADDISNIFTGLTGTANKFIPPGEYSITIKLEKYEDFELSEKVVIPARGSITIPGTHELVLLEKTGDIIIQSNPPGAQILIYHKEGNEWTTPINTNKITKETLTVAAPGTYKIHLWMEGYKDWDSHEIVLKENETYEVSVPILEKIAETAELYINSSPSGATILVDGHPINLLTPDTITFSEDRLADSDYSVNISLVKEGFTQWNGPIPMELGDKKKYEIVLQSIEKVTGSVKISTTPSNAKIFAINPETGNVDLDTGTLTPGTIDLACDKYHTIRVESEGYEPWTFDNVFVKCDATTEIHKDLKKDETQGTLRIVSTPTNATIFIEGEDVGLSSKTIDLDPGQYQITLKKVGLEDYTIEDITIEAGHQREIFAELSDQPATTGTLSILASPSYSTISVIYPDGTEKIVGVSPQMVKELEPGTYPIKISKEGYIEAEGEALVEVGQTKEFHRELRKVGDVEAELTIASVPSGAKIFANDEDTGLLTPETITFSQEEFNALPTAGFIDITLEAEDYKPWSQNVGLIMEAEKKLEVILVKEDVTTGSVKISTTPPNAKISVADIDIGLLTPATIDLECKTSHSIKVDLANYDSWTFDNIYVPCDKAVEVHKELKKKETKGSVKLISSPAYATIIVDGENLGLTTKILELEPATYNFMLRKDGYEDYIISDVVVKVGHEKEFFAKLETELATTGALSLISSPTYATITIIYPDGTEHIGGATPEIIEELEPGEYEIILKREGYSDASTQTIVKAGETPEIFLELEKKDVPDTGVIIRSSPSNAKILQTGADTGFRTPHTFKLPPGPQSFTISLAGFHDKSFDITIEEGRMSDAFVKLDPMEEEIGTLKVTSSPTNGLIKVDGIDIQKITPTTFSLAPGPHEISILKAGYSEQTKTVNITKGDSAEIFFRLIKTGVPADAGIVAIKSSPTNAFVAVDASDTGKLTPESLSLSPGSHTITISKAGYDDWTQTIVVETGKTLELLANLTATPGEEGTTEEEKAEEAAVTFAVPAGWPWASDSAPPSKEASISRII
ncbi:MAG: PEGA domain-containing protein [Candidatus Hatepunaea meridiana]|nr:PEGA domain-containing protein [Candidatus Hatepunaea meridiana]